VSIPVDIELASLQEKLDAGLINADEAERRRAALAAASLSSSLGVDGTPLDTPNSAPPVAVAYALGIDFGCTQLTVAVGTSGSKPVVVANELGNLTTPPYVGFQLRRRMLGESAVAMATRFPRDTVCAIKPLLAHDANAASAAARLQTKHAVDAASGAVTFSVAYADEQRSLSPEQCLAMLLASVKRLAATRCPGVDVDAWRPVTVLSVPSDMPLAAQRRVLCAALAAGLDARLTHDGAALAAAYAAVHGVNGPSNVRGSAAGAKTAVRALLLDVGDSGATVAVADVARASADAPGNAVRLLAVRRSGACAGALMTDAVVALVRKQFGGAQALTPKALVRLHAEAAKQKAVLSTVERTDVRLENFLDDRDLACRVTRAELLAESERSLAQLDALVAAALAAVPETERAPLHAVELVGGVSRVPAVRERASAATHADCTQGGRTLDSASTIAVGAAAIAVQLSQRSDASDQLVDASGVALAAASDVDAGAVEQLRAFESECRARDLVVAGVLNARNAVEAALLRVRERFDDPAYKSALAPARGALTALLGAEQDWLDELAGDDDGNEDDARRAMYAERLAAFETALAATAKDYVALCDEKRRQAERDRAEADENSRRVSHSSNTDAPRTNKQRLAAAELQKKGGSVSFKDLDYVSAARHFLDGVQLLVGCQNATGDTAKQIHDLQLSLLLNLSMCWLKLEKWTKAAETCTDALKLDAANGKALFRRATAYEQLGEVDKALADGKAATPADDAAIQALIKRAEAKIARRTESEKAMYKRMFS